MSDAIIRYYQPGSVTGRYGDPRPNGRIHEGIDYSHSSRPGTIAIPALRKGLVVAVWSPSSSHGYGHRIDTETDAGIVSYAHLYAASTYKRGATVQQGATVGHEGTSGFVSGPCCHIEHAVGGRKRNPAPLIAATLASTAGGGSKPLPTPVPTPTTLGDTMYLFSETNGSFFLAKPGGIVGVRGPSDLTLLRRLLASKPGAEDRFNAAERDIIAYYMRS